MDGCYQKHLNARLVDKNVICMSSALNMTKLSQPSVVIVIPAYNAGSFLKEAIESSLKQSYTECRLIVINDCSTDDTVAIQAAINNTSSNTIFIPKGVFKISAALVIRDNLRIIGDGRGSTIIKQITNTENAFEMPEGQTLVTYYQDLTVEGMGASVSSGTAFHMQSASPLTWSNSHHWTRVDIKGFECGYYCY